MKRMKGKLLILVLMISTGLSPVIQASDYEQAYAQYQKFEFQPALITFERLAEQNHLLAKYHLDWMY
jgi:hypothetical protein